MDDHVPESIRRRAFRLGYLVKCAEEGYTPSELEKCASGPAGDMAKWGIRALLGIPLTYGLLLGWGTNKLTEPTQEDIQLLKDQATEALIRNQLAQVRHLIEAAKQEQELKLKAKEDKRKQRPSVSSIDNSQDWSVEDGQLV